MSSPEPGVSIIIPKGFLGRLSFDNFIEKFLRDFSLKHGDAKDWPDKYGTDYTSKDVIMKQYCWCEKELCPYCFDLDSFIPDQSLIEVFGMSINKQAPNFWYKPLDFKVWWYKYIGRGMEYNKKISQSDFLKMVIDLLGVQHPIGV